MNFGFSNVPSVSNHEFVENAIMITKQVAKKLNTAALAIFDAPSSWWDAMAVVEVSLQTKPELQSRVVMATSQHLAIGA